MTARKLRRVIPLVCLCWSVSNPTWAMTQCGPYSCLEFSDVAEGTEVRVVPISPGSYACYLRYENTWEVDGYVTNALGPVLLMDGYPATSLLFRCDPLPGCAAWMRQREMCDLTDEQR